MKVNQLISGTVYESMDMVNIIRKSSGILFNQAAQAWNHAFYWNCLSPNGGGNPKGKLEKAINNDFGSIEAFKKEFSDKTGANFASGWGWLVQDKSTGKLSIVETDDAETPIINDSVIPIMTCDIWEHAYYIDYRNSRAEYISAFWHVLNWAFVVFTYLLTTYIR